MSLYERRVLLSETKSMKRTFTAVADYAKPVIATVPGYCQRRPEFGGE